MSKKDKTPKPKSATPPSPTHEVPNAPVVPIRFGSLIIKLLLILYLISIPMLAYWYWMRPVRVDQFKDAQTKWRAIAQQFHLPVPKDERWGW